MIGAYRLEQQLVMRLWPQSVVLHNDIHRVGVVTKQKAEDM